MTHAFGHSHSHASYLEPPEGPAWEKGRVGRHVVRIYYISRGIVPASALLRQRNDPAGGPARRKKPGNLQISAPSNKRPPPLGESNNLISPPSFKPGCFLNCWPFWVGPFSRIACYLEGGLLESGGGAYKRDGDLRLDRIINNMPPSQPQRNSDQKTSYFWSRICLNFDKKHFPKQRGAKKIIRRPTRVSPAEICPVRYNSSTTLSQLKQWYYAQIWGRLQTPSAKIRRTFPRDSPSWLSYQPKCFTKLVIIPA